MEKTIEYLSKLSLKEKCRLFNGDGSWKTYSADNKLPHIFMCDGPHGLRKQEQDSSNVNNSKVSTCFPTSSCIASSWDTSATQTLGRAIATEALAENVQLVLGPGINIKRSPLCGRNFEYFSEDPLLAGNLAAAYINAMQALGVGSCVKHFACNNQERKRQTSSSNLSEKTLREIYLRAFEIVVKKANPAAIMCSYNKINGTYAGHNKLLLTDILRKEWNYQGAVISDWGACVNPPLCLKNGMDLAMPDSFGYIPKKIEEAVESGLLTEKEIETANARILDMVQKLLNAQKDVFENGKKDNINYNSVDFEKQHEIALSLAEKSAVLLQNDGILPLKNNSKITIIGELAEFMKFQGGGSSHINVKDFPNAIQEFTNAGFDVCYSKGYSTKFLKKSQIKKVNRPLAEDALKIAKKAADENSPILYFCGLTDAYEGESFDRKSLALPEEQIELLKQLLTISKNVIVISFSGSPIDLSFAKNANAILHMYLCGEACAKAVVNLVSGKANPSGHLAETWPLHIEDTPCYKNFGLDSQDVNYEEGSLVGYRWYFAKNIPVQYKFGHGLSYTSFNYKIQPSDSNSSYIIEESDKTKRIFTEKTDDFVEVCVTNTGNVKGSEVIQVYYRKGTSGDVENAKIYLAGFEKVELLPGESKTVKVILEHSNVDNKYSDSIPEKAKPTSLITCSLEELSQKSLRAKIFLGILRTAIRLRHPGMPAEEPSVKIELSAITESPVESLVSLSGGLVSEKMAQKIVKWCK